ncbi:MAG: acetoacetate decarboxylase family protein [Acidimicrobiia bacterium]
MTDFQIMGRNVSIPVEVRDARSWFASFAVPTARAAEIVAPAGLTPARLPGGRSMLSLAFVRYVDGDLDAYHEVAVAFLVEDPAGTRAKGAYIHRLPVNQEFTCAAGRQIWGFPKFVTPIEITEGTASRWAGARQAGGRRRPSATEGTAARHGGGRRRPLATEGLRADRCVLTVDDAMALTMTLRRGVRAPVRSTAVDAFSFADGVLRRTRWELRGSDSRMRLGGVRLELGRGEIADELRSLGLPKRALVSGRLGHVAMTFQAAEVVTPSAASGV